MRYTNARASASPPADSAAVSVLGPRLDTASFSGSSSSAHPIPPLLRQIHKCSTMSRRDAVSKCDTSIRSYLYGNSSRYFSSINLDWSSFIVEQPCVAFSSVSRMTLLLDTTSNPSLRKSDPANGTSCVPFGPGQDSLLISTSCTRA